MICAPILILGFNRPDLLRGLVSILSEVQPPKLYLAIDGPRHDHPGEIESCADCSTVLDNPSWPCEVKKLIRKDNLGCRLNVSSSISWFFSQEEEGIILEDDCWPSKSFLQFATELLDRYRDDERIGIISGNNHYGYITDKKASYRFTNFVLIWGWATWRRAWKLNHPDPEAFRDTGTDIIRNANLTHRMRTMYGRFLKYDLVKRSSWAVPWMLSLQSNGLISILPRFNLVANMGHCGGGTHTNGYTYDQDLYAKCEDLAFPLVHPNSVARDIEADRLYELRSFAMLPRILTVIGLKLGVFGRGVASMAHVAERLLPWAFRL